MTRHLVFLLEERSAKEMLDGLLPRILRGEVSYRCIVFEGKQDLERQLVQRIRGYRVPHTRFVVLRDQDRGDCRKIKQRLMDLCRRADCSDALVRVACRELESWYLADLQAVENAIGITGLARKQTKRKYRSPDGLQRPSHELRLLTSGLYQKIAGSRAIGPHLDVTNTRSNSFHVFVSGVLSILPPDTLNMGSI